MPALCSKRGIARWKGIVRADGKQVSSKWFGSGKQGGQEYKAALSWEIAERDRLEQAAKVATTRTVCLTVLQWATLVLDEVKAKKALRTYEEYRTAFTRLLETLGSDYPVEAIGPVEALRHLNRVSKERTGCVANRSRKCLMAAWDWSRRFVKDFTDGTCPFSMVSRYREERRPRYVPPEEDFWAVYDVAEGQDKVMLLSFLHLAARRGEMFRLKWSDVDFVGNRVKLSTRKTRDGSWRFDWLPMTEMLKKSLLEWWENRPHKIAEYVFVVTGTRNYENQYEGEAFKIRKRWLKKLCKQAGVMEFGMHGIRHLSATVLYQAGQPQSIVQAVLRHEHASTTSRYLHSLGLEQTREALDGVFGNRGSGKVLQFAKGNVARG